MQLLITHEGSGPLLKLKIKSNKMESPTEKIKCYTMTLFGSTLIDSNINNIAQTLKIELEENIEEVETIAIQFGVKYLTQSEINALGEFDGF